MMYRFFCRKMLLVLFLGLSACGGSGEAEKVEPLGKLDFRPNSDFGFEALLTGLRLGKQAIDARTAEDGIARAEGYRFLFRLVEMNLNTLSGDHDPAHPQVSRCPSKNCKLGFDNPDYSYVGVIPLGVDYNYRLYGKRGTAALILFQVLERSTGAFVGTSRTTSEAMVVNPDGSWEIFLGKEKPVHVQESNWLQLKEDQATMVIRIAHDDWDNTIEPSIQIETLDQIDDPVASFTPMRMAVTGFALSKMIPKQVERWIGITQRGPLNDIDQPCRSWVNGCGEEGGFGNFSSGGKYLIEEDQALIIESPWVPALYRNIQLANIWGESLDYANKQTSLNGFQAHIDNDKVYRYVLAHEDPGVPNWLDVSEHGEGTIFMRWLNTEEGTDPLKPNGTLVKLKELRDHLPAHTPEVSKRERADVLKSRLAAYNRRMNPANIHE